MGGRGNGSEGEREAKCKGGVASVRARAVNRKRSRKRAGRYLVDVFAFPDKFFHWPFGQHAKFRCDETYFARTAPYDGWCTTVRDKLFEFLSGTSGHVPGRAMRKMTYEQGTLKTPLHKHFVFVCHGHLQRNQRWSKDGKRPNDAQNIILFESVTQGGPTRDYQELVCMHASCLGAKAYAPGGKMFHEEMVALGIVVRVCDVEWLLRCSADTIAN